LQDAPLLKVVVYDMSEGWTSLLDYFSFTASSSTSNFELSSVGSRAAYNTTYVRQPLSRSVRRGPVSSWWVTVKRVNNL